MAPQQKCEVPMKDLLEVWKILEVLVVSIDRIGEFELAHGKDLAKTALDKFMAPAMCTKIARARSLLVDMLADCDPHFLELSEELANDEAAMGYWDGMNEA